MNIQLQKLIEELKADKERFIDKINEQPVTEFDHTFYSGKIDSLSLLIPKLEKILNEGSVVASKNPDDLGRMDNGAVRFAE